MTTPPPDAGRTYRGVGIVPGIGSGPVTHRKRPARTGFREVRGRVIVCADLGEVEAVLLLYARPAAIVVTGNGLTHGVAVVLREAGIPVVSDVPSLGGGEGLGVAAVVDGTLGTIWANALLVPAGVAVK